MPSYESDPPPPPHQAQRLPGEKPSSLSRSNTSEGGAPSSSDAAAAEDEPEPLFRSLSAVEPRGPPGPRFVTDPGGSGAISPSELDDDDLSARSRDLPPQIGTPPDSPPDSPQHQPQPPQPQPPQPQPPSFGGGAAAAAPKRAAAAALPSERAKKASRLGGLGADVAAPAGGAGVLPASLLPLLPCGTPSPSDDEDDGEANGVGGTYASMGGDGAGGAGSMAGLGGDGEAAVAMHEERTRCRRAELQARNLRTLAHPRAPPRPHTTAPPHHRSRAYQHLPAPLAPLRPCASALVHLHLYLHLHLHLHLQPPPQ